MNLGINSPRVWMKQQRISTVAKGFMGITRTMYWRKCRHSLNLNIKYKYKEKFTYIFVYNTSQKIICVKWVTAPVSGKKILTILVVASRCALSLEQLATKVRVIGLSTILNDPWVEWVSIKWPVLWEFQNKKLFVHSCFGFRQNFS